jgi:hypothetical protein
MASKLHNTSDASRKGLHCHRCRHRRCRRRWGLRDSSPWAPFPNNTSHCRPLRRPPTSSGYDHRNSHSPIVFRLGRHVLVILPLHGSDVHWPSTRSRDLLVLDRVVTCVLRSGHALCNGCGRSSWSPWVAWARIASPPPSMAPWRLASTLRSSGTSWLLRGCKRMWVGMDSWAPISAN